MTGRLEGPLSGIRVLDLGQYIAGPAVAMMLADHGADVIKVDPPGGPRWQSPVNAVLDRGKSRITLDVREPADLDVVRRLAASSDVFIENSRPGVMRTLGLGADDLTSLNPRLVYLSLPGLSSREEHASDLRAWEGVLAAMGGMFSDMSVHRQLYGAAPSYSPLPMPSANAAALGTLGVLTALFNRQRTGRGEVVEVPLLAALCECTPFNTMRVHDLPERYSSDAEDELARRKSAGTPCDMTFAEVDELRDPFYARYVCRDGRPFFVCCVGHQGHIQRLLKGVGLWDQLVAEGVPRADPFTSSRTWGAESQGNTIYAYPLKGPWARRIRGLLRERFATRTSTEWERFFSEQHIPGVADRSTEEWLACDHALGSGLVVPVEDPEFGGMLQPGPYFWTDRYRDTYGRPKPAHRPDADREAIVAGAASADPAKTPESVAPGGDAGAKLPLDGLRILDASNVIAGPTAAGVLTRFGAECIKLDRPFPELDPGLSVFYSLHCSRGKRSLLLDLKKQAGQEVLRRLLESVDVVVYNGLDRQLEGLGLDLASLQSMNPSVILCRVSAYGGPHPGPRSGDPGYDECAQSLTGLTVRNGGSLETAEETASVGCLDNLCGFLGSCAIVLALLERARDGGSMRVETSLAATSQLLQLPFLYQYDGRPPFDEPAGPEALGEHALCRLYQTGDGWVFVAATGRQYEAMRALPEFADLTLPAPSLTGEGPCARLDPAARADDRRLAGELKGRFARRPTQYWLGALGTLGIGVSAVRSYDEVVDAGLVAEDVDAHDVPAPAFVRHEPHPSGHVIDQVAQSAIRLRWAEVVEPGPPPKFGAQTKEILAELGLSGGEIDELIRSGTAREIWS
ncbi:MAG: CoA transferase, partial [Thermoleophilia bacterium]|nr:CoA transferase [Thermoleophilia bacterium]